jgi:hypothetical protein
MKNLIILFTLSLIVYAFCSCKKDETKSERFILLTSHIWVADSLLANGNDESGDTGLLRKFRGDTKFNEDGTGYVGEINGTWDFADNENAIIIISDSLPIPVTTLIEELTQTSLKITTSYPDPLNPMDPMDVRMTFKPK